MDLTPPIRDPHNHTTLSTHTSIKTHSANTCPALNGPLFIKCLLSVSQGGPCVPQKNIEKLLSPIWVLGEVCFFWAIWSSSLAGPAQLKLQS